MSRIKEEIRILKLQLYDILNLQLYNRLLEYYQTLFTSESSSKKQHLRTKFENLLQRHSPTQSRDNLIENRIYNISSKVLSPDENNVLSKGLNFAPTPKYVPKD